MKLDPELRDYLDGVRKIVANLDQIEGAPTGGGALAGFLSALRAADVIGLAEETREVDGSLTWLAATVGEIATAVPAVAFALASRYVGYRAVSSLGDVVDSSATSATVLLPSYASTDAGHGSRNELEAVVATLLEPSMILGLDLERSRAIVARCDDLTPLDDQDTYSGLDGAGLVRMSITGPALVDLDATRARAAVHDWNVLCSAVLLGIAQSSMLASETYAADRRQFGGALTSFAAIRSMLAQMAVRVESLESLLDRALDAGPGSAASFAVTAEAGRVSTGVALDAIQIHGGYGYIEEYPVARQLRDAVTTSARSGGRRSALASLAAGRIGVPPWGEMT